ncbi:MAG: hypothetical protein LBD18_06820 [Treponema sp.]|jgi:hypothetical protein|nr:hypothetical protein [Treponema sp.]
MSGFISKKWSLVILLAGLCIAGITALLLNYGLAEPQLGPVYDILLDFRPAPPVSGEILVIDTDETIEPGDVFSVLMSLSEMGASDLIIEVPVLGASLGRIENDEEIRQRINDEYALLGRNIRNLFEAIRVGSVSPSESSGYVESLVELTERGRDRLNAALMRQKEAGSVQVARSSMVFGTVLEAADLRPHSIGNIPWYSRPRPDKDGKIRRVAPFIHAEGLLSRPSGVLQGILNLNVMSYKNPSRQKSDLQSGDGLLIATAAEPYMAARFTDSLFLEEPPSKESAGMPPAPESAPAAETVETFSKEGPAQAVFLPPVSGVEHIVYRGLKPRWEESMLEYTEQGPVLVNRKNSEETFRFPLDRNGNILVETPEQNESFRRLTLAQFREYEEAGHAMRRLLKYAEGLGVYSETMPERIPLILCDYAASLQEELLQAPDQENLAAWRKARAEYISSLDEFLYGSAEMILVNRYEELIAAEALNDEKDEEIEEMQNIRDELIRTFVDMREQYQELAELRTILSETLASSFCILGPPLSPLETGASITEASALLANALLTGRCITPGQSRHIIFWSLAVAFIVLICIHTLRPPVALLAGLSASLLCFVGFGWSFVITSYWLDPQIPAASCLMGTLVIFTIRFLIIRQGERYFYLAYGPVVSKNCLKQLIKTGRPPLSEIINVRAAIIAVKNPGLLSREDMEGPGQAAMIAATFRGQVSAAFKKAGAAILGCEGDTILVCFGSPPERVYLEHTKTETQYGDEPKAHSSHHPAAKAAGCIAELLQGGSASANESPSSAWRFGIACGDCAFSWSGETGYIANGSPVVRARVLASLALRYKAQVLITDSVREKINLPVRRLSALGNNGNSGENFYELLIP